MGGEGRMRGAASGVRERFASSNWWAALRGGDALAACAGMGGVAAERRADPPSCSPHVHPDAQPTPPTPPTQTPSPGPPPAGTPPRRCPTARPRRAPRPRTPAARPASAARRPRGRGARAPRWQLPSRRSGIFWGKGVVEGGVSQGGGAVSAGRERGRRPRAGAKGARAARSRAASVAASKPGRRQAPPPSAAAARSSLCRVLPLVGAQHEAHVPQPHPAAAGAQQQPVLPAGVKHHLGGGEGSKGGVGSAARAGVSQNVRHGICMCRNTTHTHIHIDRQTDTHTHTHTHTHTLHSRPPPTPHLLQQPQAGGRGHNPGVALHAQVQAVHAAALRGVRHERRRPAPLRHVQHAALARRYLAAHGDALGGGRGWFGGGWREWEMGEAERTSRRVRSRTAGWRGATKAPTSQPHPSLNKCVQGLNAHAGLETVGGARAPVYLSGALLPGLVA